MHHQEAHRSSNTHTFIKKSLFFISLLLITGFLISCNNKNGELANLFSTDTPTATITTTPTKTTTPTVTKTPTATTTFTPVNTPTATIDVTATQVMIMTMTAGTTKTARAETAQAKVAIWATQTAEARCRQWDEVTLDDVGKTMCVTGTVREAWIDYQQYAFFMTFGYEPDDLYMVVYNGWYFVDVENHCVQFEGEIMRLGDTPVFVVNPSPGWLYLCD